MLVDKRIQTNTEHCTSHSLGCNWVTESSLSEVDVERGEEGNIHYKNSNVPLLSSACEVCRSAPLRVSLCSHIPQTYSCGCRHLVDYPALHTSLSSLEKQNQLFLLTLLSQIQLSSTEVFHLLKCFIFECKFLVMVLYLAYEWSQKVQSHKVITVSVLFYILVLLLLLAHQHVCDPMGHVGLMKWESC